MIGRNDPCWCGSGKKYKKCHLSKEKEYPGKSSPVSGNSKIKTPEEIEGMRKAGAFNGEMMDYIRPYIKAGISSEEINTLVHTYTVTNGHIPACLGYHKFPKSVCVSVNEVVCHGIPAPEIVLKDGDIVNVDLTTIVNGFYGDSSETFLIGNVSDEARRLVNVSAESLQRGINAVGPGKPLSVVGEAIQPYAESQNCSVVQRYTGHGVGKKFHEYFTVCHHISPDCDDVILLPGMTFTIEPMINLGTCQVLTDRVDGWTVRTKDGALSAQFEHTILITDKGAEVLTRTPSQKDAGTILNFPD